MAKEPAYLFRRGKKFVFISECPAIRILVWFLVRWMEENDKGKKETN
ncbi:hypothetical protein SD77_0535 [Bacillus badius]|uniref:Uncharacterized protein n=1 Tax=Bacillus badius TaxID=1455 RepID=A0ABR5B115_BACBA|nr:hypothetical protein SD77_0535 [Bacillus badius]